MNSTLMIILGVAGLALILIGATMRSGPRVTHIETHREERDVEP